MNILLIDSALPSSVYSGKTVRFRNIYGRLANTERIVYLRVLPAGVEKESIELEVWAAKTFHACLRLTRMPKAKLTNRLSAIACMRPWYDLFAKHPDQVEQIKSRLVQLINEYRIDTVITFDQEVAQYGLLVSEIKPWFQDLGDSMQLQIKRQMAQARLNKKLNYLLRLWRESKFEHEMIEKAKATIFVAEDDASIHRNGTSAAIEVIANGVDTDYFNPDAVPGLKSQPEYVVFTGHMNFPPNEEAAVAFANEIFPQIRNEFPSLKFKIVGADPSPKVLNLRSIDGVEVTESVPDIRPYLKSAKMFVCYMRSGSGIKNKILEALSMKIPIVATPLSLKGIQHLPNGVVEIADNSADFSAQVKKCIENPARHFVERGREFVIKNYSWNLAINRYQLLLSK